MKASDILEVFRFQAQHTAVYARYLELLGVDPLQITSPEFIPFLPIRFFKSHTVYNGSRPPEHVFTSSATTGMAPSHHPVDSLERYGQGVLDTFRLFYGNPSAYTILALLPSYMERPGSSLVYMMQVLMKKVAGKQTVLPAQQGRFIPAFANSGCQRKARLVTGSCICLLDFAETYTVTHPGLTVVETGGMKGKGVELSRETLHLRLKSGFPSSPIHSEYSMAELFSQAYACEEDLYFRCPPSMQVFIRDLQDPFRYLKDGIRGGINITDLENRHSCSFIETEDLGLRLPDGRFQVLGRIPAAELRGCNMLIDL